MASEQPQTGSWWFKNCDRYRKWQTTAWPFLVYVVLGLGFAIGAYFWPNADLIRIERGTLFVILFCVLLSLILMIVARERYAEKLEGEVRKYRKTEQPATTASFMAQVSCTEIPRFDEATSSPWLAFPAAGAIALFAFSLYVFVVSAPDYLQTAVDHSRVQPQFMNLAATTPDSPGENILRVSGGSIYFSAITMATTGYGDVEPSVQGHWARLLAATISCFTMLMIPLMIQSIMTHHAKIRAIRKNTIPPPSSN